MGRPRMPLEKAELLGSTIANPGRFRRRSNPKVRSLGPAPKRFTPDQRKIWDEINADVPWVGRSDRQLVALACHLQSMINDGGDVPIAVYAQLRLVLSSLAMTPVDRSKVATPDDENDHDDPAAEFLS